MPDQDAKRFDPADRRIAPRFQVNLPIKIAALDSKSTFIGEGRISDISEGGLAIISRNSLVVGSNISIEFRNCVLAVEVRHSRARSYSSRPEYLTGVAITEVLRGEALWRQLLEGRGDAHAAAQKPVDDAAMERLVANGRREAELDSSSVQPTQARPEAQQRILQTLEELPPFPPVVRHVLASLSGDENRISLPGIGTLIARDALLAGKILGVANSPLYNRGQEIASVRQAVARLGINRLRNVVLGLSANRIWSRLHAPPQFSMERFNLHAMAAAAAAEVLAHRFFPELKDHCFIAGLFHDIGELLLVHLYPQEYATLWNERPSRGKEHDDRERALFGMTHAEVSAGATAYWNLPEIVQAAVLYHEQPPDSGLGGRLSPNEITHAADRYADACGYALFDRPGTGNSPLESLSPLGVDPEEIRPAFMQQMSTMR